LASWPVAQGVAVDAPVRARRSRTQAKRARARGGILWIALSGVLLAGVVFVNVAVLRANLALDSSTNQRAKLRAENQALQSQLASALASSKIQSRAQHQLGLVAADPSATQYLNLAP
jgi:cell division protein FtsL